MKVDRSFVRDVLTKHSVGVIAGTILTMGRHLGLTVVAVGVELKSSTDFLQDMVAMCIRAFSSAGLYRRSSWTEA